MKINLHQHTMKIKSGELKTRNLDIKNSNHINTFINNLKRFNVGIVAITNHNWFDLNSFNILEERCKSEGILLLPGIEIDIEDSHNIRHNLNIIVSNEKKNEFSKFINSLVFKLENAKNFKISIDNLITSEIKSFEKIYLIPNKQKGDKDLPNADLEKIKKDSDFWFLETTNKKSSRILSYKRQNTIYGSDEHDIFNPNYKDLPDTRIKISSFKNLLRFLKKDSFFLEEEKENKKLTNLQIKPKNWNQTLNFSIYKDVNIIIGPRGTGKSELFNEIKYDIKQKNKVEFDVYEQKNNGYEEILKREKTKFNYYENLEFTQEVTDLNYIIENNVDYNFKEVLSNFNQIIKYYNQKKSEKYKCWFEFIYSSELMFQTSKQHILEDEYKNFKTKIKSLKLTLSLIEKFKDKSDFFIKNYNTVKQYINDLIILESKIFSNFYIKNQSFKMIKITVEKVKEIIKGMTSQVSLPGELGFVKSFESRMKLKNIFQKLLRWDSVVSKQRNKLGEILDNKTLYVKRIYEREFSKKDGYFNLNNLPASSYKEITKFGVEILENIWNELLQQKIKTYIECMKDKKLLPLRSEMFIWYKDIIEDQDGNIHNPSEGEKQILNLTNYLEKEQDFYFLDEPENSLDNYFINNVIVEKINKKANEGKTFVIVTHNANITVRTNPFLTIYRLLSEKGDIENETYYGNAFDNVMYNNEKEKIANFTWSDICEKILEGGKEAFYDRANYYSK